MERNINQIINHTQSGLDELRSNVIGFLKDSSGNIGDEMILSISDDKQFADTVRISPLGAIHHMHGLPTVNFEVVMIPEKYGNFKNLLDHPIEFGDFHNENFKK